MSLGERYILLVGSLGKHSYCTGVWMAITMKSTLRSFFPGKATHWLICLGLLVLLIILGQEKLHVRDFVMFVSTLLIASAIAVEVIIATGLSKKREKQEFTDKSSEP